MLVEEYIPLEDVRKYVDHSGVYEIVCGTTGRVYIGQSTSIASRVIQHLNQLDRDDHSNKLLQHDWNRLEPAEFSFKLVMEVPFEDQRELLRQERNEIERRRKYGVQLYNDFKRLPITPEEEAAKKEVAKPKQKTNYSVAEMIRAAHSNGRTYSSPYHPGANAEIVSCYDCGATGALNLTFFRCDDEQVRCESCTDKHLGSMSTWLERQQPIKRESKKRRMRWQMHTGHLRQEALLAMAAYTAKHHAKPGKILFHKEAGIGGVSIAGTTIRKDDLTPKGYLDLPLPEESNE